MLTIFDDNCKQNVTVRLFQRFQYMNVKKNQDERIENRIIHADSF